MKIKILGILVMTLLLTTVVLPVAGTVNVRKNKLVNVDRNHHWSNMIENKEYREADGNAGVSFQFSNKCTPSKDLEDYHFDDPWSDWHNEEKLGFIDPFWQRYWGGPLMDVVHGIAVDENGDIYLSGTTVGSTSWTDVFLLKYDKMGTLLWSRTFDRGLNQREEGSRLDIDQFGNVYIAGRATTTEGLLDTLLVKYSPDGDLLWYRTYDTADGERDAAYSVVVDEVHNWVVLTGWKHVSPYPAPPEVSAVILRCDYDGNQLHTISWMSPVGWRDYFRETVLNEYGDLYVAGFYDVVLGESSVVYDYVIVHYDKGLNWKWERLWGFCTDEMDFFCGITMDEEGYIYTAGYSECDGCAPGQITIHKLNPDNGEDIWVRTWGGILREDTWGITVGEDGYLYVAGSTEMTKNNNDSALLKFDLDGRLLGTLIWGGNDDDRGRDVFVTSTCIYFCGYTKSYGSGEEDVFLLAAPTGALDIEIPTGGFFLKVPLTISNLGLSSATDLYWSVDIDPISIFGLVFFGGQKQGSIAEILPGEQKVINVGSVFGLGLVKITATVGCIEEKAKAFVFSPFISIFP